VYAIVLDWPKDNTLTLGAPSPSDTTGVSLLGYHGDALSWKRAPSGGMTITIPSINYNNMPCEWAWVVKLEGLKNPHRISIHTLDQRRAQQLGRL
jgi:alpha-L-fucosidase